jgi:hypothetical protein
MFVLLHKSDGRKGTSVRRAHAFHEAADPIQTIRHPQQAYWMLDAKHAAEVPPNAIGLWAPDEVLQPVVRPVESYECYRRARS